MNIGLRHTHCGLLRNNALFSNQGVDWYSSKKNLGMASDLANPVLN